MSTNWIRCPRCNGWGYTIEWVKHPDSVQATFFGKKVQARKTCWKCDGKGRVKEPSSLGRFLDALFSWE
jgi:hypothetical protein